MKELISLEDYKMGRDKLYPQEWTKEIEANAIKLLSIINSFLNELGINEVKVSSGWRPAEINSQTQNAAKRSYHMNGMACDLLDNKDQDLAKLAASNPDLLRKYGLFLENPQATQGKNSNWCHLDLGIRSDRPSRIFNT